MFHKCRNYASKTNDNESGNDTIGEDNWNLLRAETTFDENVTTSFQMRMYYHQQFAVLMSLLKTPSLNCIATARMIRDAKKLFFHLFKMP